MTRQIPFLVICGTDTDIGKTIISALIVPSYDNLNIYLNKINKDNLSYEALIDHPDIIKLVDSEIEKSMTKFASYETVKKFKLISSPFTIERGELTPKMSIVRKKVINNYSELIDSIYK